MTTQFGQLSSMHAWGRVASQWCRCRGAETRLNLGGFEVFAEHALQRSNGRLDCFIAAEVRVPFEPLLQEVVCLLVLGTGARALHETNCDMQLSMWGSAVIAS